MNGPLLDPASEWASLLLESLAEAGIEDVVVSPGARSAPFVLAAVRAGNLRLHDVIDERSAAFFALGQARVTGRPSLLLCTSGTAPTHYFPAVVEADLGHVPLVILSADRPLELQGCGAPQTVDQMKLFGEHVRSFHDLGLADSALSALRAVRRIAAQAVASALGPPAGAVHLNVRARKPLEPRHAEASELGAANAIRSIGRQPIPCFFAAQRRPSPAGIARIAQELQECPTGLLVAGPASLEQERDRSAVVDLARATGLPLLADPTSQLRFGLRPDPEVLLCDGFDALSQSARFRRALRPRLVLQLGRPPISSGWERWLDEQPDIARHVVAPHGWSDPTSSARTLVEGELGSTVAALTAALATGPRRSVDRAFAAWLASANELAWRVIGSLLDEPGPLDEAQVARAVAEGLPERSLFFLGNSLSVRLAGLFCGGKSCNARVLSQRGVNGIDGLISGAAGAAASGGRVTALIGDVSALHDLGGLLIASRIAAPIVFVIVNNGGGRIFDRLPFAVGCEGTALAHFTTPHQTSFASAAATFGVSYRRVVDRPALALALAEAHARGGATVIEALVGPDGTGLRERLLGERIDAALEREGLFAHRAVRGVA